MTNCISDAIRFKGIMRRKVEAVVSAQVITSDGGSQRAVDDALNPDIA
jgi:hypothetical protein